MLLDTTKPITDFSGAPIKNGEDELTIGKLIQMAVLQPAPSDQNRTGEDKAKLMRLALRANDGEVEYSAEEIGMLKARVGEIFAPLVVGRAFDLLDPPATKANASAKT